ncbi:MAG: SDR family oxidoreductase [Hyphomicrobiaceae bacterium]
MSSTLQGKVALVTGGAGGIGQAILARFRAEGATAIAGDLRADANGIRLDVTDEASVAAGLDQIETDHGRLDILLNGAGIELECTIEETTLAEWNRIFAVNVTGTFLVSKAALPLMRRSGGGSIVNIGSYDGFLADPKLAAYCATKGAVHALTKAMAVDHGPEGIRVNAICPGYIDTPMLRQFFGGSADDPATWEAARAVHPTRRVGTPEDVASLATWLASDEARYASGQLWVLDGGLTAQAPQMRM